MKYWYSCVIGSFAGLALLCNGCGSAPKDPNRKPVVRVAGKVLVDGKPVKDVRVEFHSADPTHIDNVESSGKTDAYGAFRMMTYATGDGAPKGDYVVTFELKAGNYEPDQLKNLYNDPKTSTFKVTVADKSLQLEPYDLKTEGVEAKESTKVLDEHDAKKLKKRQAK